MQLANRVNYAEEINYVLNELWMAGGKSELNPVRLKDFMKRFSPANMKARAPAKFKKQPAIFWESLVYKISQKEVNIRANAI
jgi:hypothetical protein